MAEILIEVEPIQRASVEFNYDVIEEGIRKVEEAYKDLVFTQDSIKEAKKDRTKLNKLVASLKEERTEAMRMLTRDILPFENTMKDFEKRVKALSENIGDQIKSFEDKEKEERKEIVKNYINNICSHRPELAYYLEAIDLNKTVYTAKANFKKDGSFNDKIMEALGIEIEKAERIVSDLALKRDLITTTCKEANENFGLKVKMTVKQFVYLKDYPINEVVTEINNVAKSMKEQEELLEKEKAENNQNPIVTPKKKKGLILCFTNMTVEKAELLKEFLEENSIEYEKM